MTGGRVHEPNPLILYGSAYVVYCKIARGKRQLRWRWKEGGVWGGGMYVYCVYIYSHQHLDDRVAMGTLCGG